jgi:hypothetical protein
MDLQIFQGGGLSFYAFALGFKEFKGGGGGLITFSKRGNYTKQVYNQGGSF